MSTPAPTSVPAPAAAPTAPPAGEPTAFTPLFKQLSPPADTRNGGAAIRRPSGGGQPLDQATRSDMEAFFGRELGDVRVHADADAAELARDLGAEALTIGRDVYFGQGRFDPRGRAGKALLGHELTHVLQQSGEAPASDPERSSVDARPTARESEAQAVAQSLLSRRGRLADDTLKIERYECAYSTNRPPNEAERLRLETIAQEALDVCREILRVRQATFPDSVRALERVNLDVTLALSGSSDREAAKSWGLRMAAAILAAAGAPASLGTAAAPGAGAIMASPDDAKRTAPAPATTKIDVKREAFTVEAATLADAAAELDTRDEWGRTSWAVNYSYESTDGVVTAVTVTATIRVELPSWTALGKQRRPVQAEWNRMMTALRAHEESHVRIARERIQALAGELLGKPEADLPGLYENALRDLQRRSDEYDDRTAHGQTESVTLDLGVATQRKGLGAVGVDEAEAAARAVEAAMLGAGPDGVAIAPTAIGVLRSDEADAIKQKLKAEIDKAFEARDKWKEAGNTGQAIYSERLGLLLGRKSADKFASMKELDDYIAESDKAALTELDTMAKVGLDKVDLFPHAFPLTWAARVRNALSLDVDIAALRKRLDEDQKYADNLAKRLPSSLFWWGLARTYQEALQAEAPFKLELRHAEWPKSHASRDYAMGWIEYARSQAQVSFYEEWDKAVQSISADIESGKLIMDNTKQAEYREFVANKRAALIAVPGKIRAWGPSREEPFTDIGTIALVSANVSTLLSQLTFVPIWSKAQTEHAARVGETDATIAGLDANGRVFQAMLWAYEGDYFSEAGKKVVEAMKAGAEENAHIMIAALIAQMIPYVNVAVDVYFLYQGVKGVDASVKGLSAAFASAGNATTTVDLQRESAKLATAIVGQGANLILSLLAIAGTVAALRAKIAKIKAETPNISEEDALKKAMQDTPTKELGALGEAAARTRLRAHFDEAVLVEFADKGVKMADLEVAINSGAKPQHIRAITLAQDAVRVRALIKYAGENAVPISNLLEAGAEPALVGRLMDAKYGLPEVTAANNTYSVIGGKRFGALKLDEAVRIGKLNNTALQRVNGLVSENAFAMLAKRSESMHQNVALATELASADAAMNAELVQILEQHGINKVAPAHLEQTLVRLNAFVQRHGARVSGDYVTRFLRSVRTTGDPVQALAELELAEDILAGKTPLGPAKEVHGIPDPRTQGKGAPEYRVTPADGGAGGTRIAEVKKMPASGGGLSTNNLKRNLSAAVAQIVERAATTGERGAYVRLDGTLAGPTKLADSAMDGAVIGTLVDPARQPPPIQFVEWVEIRYIDGAGASKTVMYRVVNGRVIRT